ncbi:MAG TPA: RNA ligase [Methanosarcinaceae archaeon]|nr:RNA ligase [Methanosarcinaceae archaeon]
MNTGSDTAGIKLDIENAAGYLNLPQSRLKGLLDRRILLQIWNMGPVKGRDELQRLFRFDKSVSKIEHGSVLYQKDGTFELIRGFPKIQRAMLLGPALDRHFSNLETVAVEEKMNGYNVRVADVGGKILAFTRGGLVCPYSTERAGHLLERDFFDDHPDLILCGEMAGPDNPYVPKDIYGIGSLDFFVFDIRHKGSGTPYSLHERRKLAGEYGLNQVTFFGEFSLNEAPDEIAGIIRELGKIQHEGVVIKDPQMILNPIKYTCSQSNCADLRHAFKFYNDIGQDYFFSRVVREGFQSVEWDENEEELQKRCLQLGESILGPMIESIKQVRDGTRIADNVQIRVKDPDTISTYKDYLRRLGVDTVFGEPERIGDEYLVKIRKLNQSTNDKTESMCKGELW